MVYEKIIVQLMCLSTFSNELGSEHIFELW
jgi:hypothetical protein